MNPKGDKVHGPLETPVIHIQYVYVCIYIRYIYIYIYSVYIYSVQVAALCFPTTADIYRQSFPQMYLDVVTDRPHSISTLKMASPQSGQVATGGSPLLIQMTCKSVK